MQEVIYIYVCTITSPIFIAVKSVLTLQMPNFETKRVGFPQGRAVGLTD